MARGWTLDTLERKFLMEATAALIVAVATLITAIGAVIIGIINSYRINDVHISINSRMDQLLLAHGKEMKAEGVKEERDRV
jgi:hypothetical protein